MLAFSVITGYDTLTPSRGCRLNMNHKNLKAATEDMGSSILSPSRAGRNSATKMAAAVYYGARGSSHSLLEVREHLVPHPR